MGFCYSIVLFFVAYTLGSLYGETNAKNILYFDYMLTSSYGIHVLGSNGKTEAEAKSRLDHMIKRAKENKWSIIGEPLSVEGKEGNTYMYQRIMKLYWGKYDEQEE